MASVEIARLDGSISVEPVEPGETVLELKRRLAVAEAMATTDFRLLSGCRVLRNEEPLQQAELQMVRCGRAIPEDLDWVAASGAPGQWLGACEQVRELLKERKVEQGQVVWVDLHSSGHSLDAEGVVVCAYFDHRRRGHGELQLCWELIFVEDLARGFQRAVEFGENLEVISITASSALQMKAQVAVAVFYYGGELRRGQLQVVSSAGGAWDEAAAKLVMELNGLKLQMGQVLGIDAHNYGPDAKAMFSAVYSRDFAGHGDLSLDWVALNQQNWWSDFHAAGRTMSSGKDVLSITSSSNCDGRSVQYSFYQVEASAEYVEVVQETWDLAAEELIRTLRRDVQRGQVVAIDAHSAGLEAPAVLLAVFRRSRCGCGPLDLSLKRRTGHTWSELYNWACKVAADVEVTAITGTSSSDGCQLLIFHGAAVPRRNVVYAASVANWWNGACDHFLQRLPTLGREQLLAIDAHSSGPEEDARFCGWFCEEPAAEPVMNLQYRCFNVAAEWPQLHKQSVVQATSHVLAITGSSNEAGRKVLYAFHAT